MTEELKDKILSIRPEYSDNGDSTNPLPYEVSLYYQEDDYLIDLTLDVNDVLNAEILINEEDYELSDSDVKFICKYLSGLLDYEIQVTERYYEAERNEQDNYYYYS
jgi:hypothetical protein